MHFRCLFYNMKILYTKSKVSEHSSWSRAARQPAKSRMRLASRRFATPGLESRKTVTMAARTHAAARGSPDL